MISIISKNVFVLTIHKTFISPSYRRVHRLLSIVLCPWLIVSRPSSIVFHHKPSMKRSFFFVKLLKINPQLSAIRYHP